MNREEFIKEWDEAKEYIDKTGDYMRKNYGCFVIETEEGDYIYATDYISRPNCACVLLILDKYLVAEMSYSRIKRVIAGGRIDVIKYNKGSD